MQKNSKRIKVYKNDKEIFNKFFKALDIANKNDLNTITFLKNYANNIRRIRIFTKAFGVIKNKVDEMNADNVNQIRGWIITNFIDEITAIKNAYIIDEEDEQAYLECKQLLNKIFTLYRSFKKGDISKTELKPLIKQFLNSPKSTVGSNVKYVDVLNDFLNDKTDVINTYGELSKIEIEFKQKYQTFKNNKNKTVDEYNELLKMSQEINSINPKNTFAKWFASTKWDAEKNNFVKK